METHQWPYKDYGPPKRGAIIMGCHVNLEECTELVGLGFRVKGSCGGLLFWC